MSAATLPSRPCTEAGLAERLADRVSDQYKFCEELGGWMNFTGARWERGEFGLKHEALKAARGISAEAAVCLNDDERPKLKKFAVTCEKNSTLSGALAIARALPEFAVQASAFDSDPWALNVLNGTIDLRTGICTKHNAKSLHTMVANVTYDAGSTCPQWLAFIERILPDKDTRHFVQKLAGYCLTGLTNERVFVVFHGSGDNGKSLLLKVLARMFGDYACYPEHDMLLSSDKDKHSTGLADLRGKRLACMSEVEKGRKFNEAALKRLTGDEPITARHMHCDHMTFDMLATFIMAANDRPRASGDAKAVWNRVREVPFGVSIPKGEQDLHLATKLCTELSGILNWALDGLAAWRTETLGTCQAVIDATAAYRAESDYYSRFIHEKYTRNDAGRLPKAELLLSYQSWAQEQGLPSAISEKAFTAEMRNRGVEDHRGTAGQRYWKLTDRIVTSDVE